MNSPTQAPDTTTEGILLSTLGLIRRDGWRHKRLGPSPASSRTLRRRRTRGSTTEAPSIPHSTHSGPGIRTGPLCAALARKPPAACSTGGNTTTTPR